MPENTPCFHRLVISTSTCPWSHACRASHMCLHITTPARSTITTAGPPCISRCIAGDHADLDTRLHIARARQVHQHGEGGLPCDGHGVHLRGVLASHRRRRQVNAFRCSLPATPTVMLAYNNRTGLSRHRPRLPLPPLPGPHVPMHVLPAQTATRCQPVRRLPCLTLRSILHKCMFKTSSC